MTCAEHHCAIVVAAMAAVTAELSARRALDRWEREDDSRRLVGWFDGKLVAAQDRRVVAEGPSHVEVAARLGLGVSS